MGYAQRMNEEMREVVREAKRLGVLLRRGTDDPVEPDTIRARLDRNVDVGSEEEYTFTARPEPTESTEEKKDEKPTS